MTVYPMGRMFANRLVLLYCRRLKFVGEVGESCAAISEVPKGMLLRV